MSSLPDTPVTNILGGTVGKITNFLCVSLDDIGNNTKNGFSGYFQLQHNKRYYYSAKFMADAWSKISSIGNFDKDGIVYIFHTVIGARKLTYVGKTEYCLKKRYQKISGGLSQVLNKFLGDQSATLDVTIYSTNTPGTLEGWCYDVLAARTDAFNLVNKINPG
ncbi:MAG: hypothetical protein KGM17_12295 [Sphingomonadales bacterium]|nr:hypothetical protein [Sphingomonadales bacterium]